MGMDVSMGLGIRGNDGFRNVAMRRIKLVGLISCD